jgi:hypothetical protein
MDLTDLRLLLRKVGIPKRVRDQGGNCDAFETIIPFDLDVFDDALLVSMLLESLKCQSG